MNFLSNFELKTLLEYNSNTILPSDFELEWQEGLGIINSMPLNVKIIANTSISSSFCKFYDLWFTSIKDSRIYAKLIVPNDNLINGKGILMFHGYSGNSGGWTDKPPKLSYVAQGFTVLAMDCRGQGGKSFDEVPRPGWNLRGHIVRGISDKVSDLYYRDLYLDTVQLFNVMQSFSWIENEISAFGESQGGALTIVCSALTKKLYKIGVIFPFLSDFKNSWQYETSDNAYIEIREYIRRFHPTNLEIEKLYSKLSYIDLVNFAPLVSSNSLFAMSLCDSRCPPPSQFAVFNSIIAKKDYIVYPNYGHEWLPGIQDSIFNFLTNNE